MANQKEISAFRIYFDTIGKFGIFLVSQNISPSECHNFSQISQMAQPDCPNTDLSNGAIVHSPAGICSDLDTQRGREDEDRKEEEEEVELAEEVGEDVLMIAGDGEEVEENTEQNEPEEERIIQTPRQSNGVINEEKTGAGSLKENYEEEEESRDKDNQNIDKETNEDEEEESNDGHTMVENPCDLLTVIDEKREEQLLDNDEERQEDDRDEEDLIKNLETGVREEKVSEENGSGENFKENCAEEEHDGEDNQHIDEETNEEEMESSGEEESNDRHTKKENPCELKTVIDGEGQVQLLDNSEDDKQDTEYEANKQDVTECLETEIREEKIGNTDDVFGEQELGSCTDDADYIHESREAQELEEGTHLFMNETYKEVLDTEGDDTEILEPPLTAVTSETSEINKQPVDESNVCQPSTDPGSAIPFDAAATVEVVENQICQITNEGEFTDENDNTRKQHVEFFNYTSLDYTENNVKGEAGKEVMTGDMPASDDVLEVESKGNQEAEQPQLNVICSEEHSQIEITSEEILPTLIFQEEQLRSDDSQMVRDEQNMTEGNDAVDGVVSEPLCEEEKGEDNDEELEKEKVVEVVAHIDPPNPVLQHVGEEQSNTQQDADTDKSGEAFKVDEAGTGEPSSPGIEDTLWEKQCTTVEKSDLPDHPLTAQSDELIRLKENMTAHLKAFIAASRGDSIEELMAEMEMANEPVTVLDDEFDELEEAPGAEMGEQKPASVTTESDDTLEPTTVKEHNDFQEKETGLEEGNEEPHKPGKEEIQMNENPKVNDRDFEFSLTDRVKELKHAMECGMLNVDPQPLKKDEGRSVRVPPHWRKDDNWIKKEPEDVKEPEVKDWRKEIKPVRKDIWEPEMGHKERSPEKKCLPKTEDWIKELKSAIKDESLPKKRDEQVKKKRVVLLEDGHSYFPQLEQRSKNKEEVKLSSDRPTESTSPPAQDSTETQDQAYEISLYVKVKKNDDQLDTLHVHSTQEILKTIGYNCRYRNASRGLAQVSPHHLQKGHWVCTYLQQSAVIVKLKKKGNY